MPRLFAALQLPPDVAFDLECLRGGIDGARWIDREAYHLTLRFIGDVDNRTAGELQYALSAIDGAPFELVIRGVGAFGGAKPRAVWAGIRQSDALMSLQAHCESACRRIGLAPEGRQFSPHITLARLKNGRASSDAVQSFIGRHALYESRPFEVTEFVLMSSRPSRGGGPYVVEERYPFEPEM